MERGGSVGGVRGVGGGSLVELSPVWSRVNLDHLQLQQTTTKGFVSGAHGDLGNDL